MDIAFRDKFTILWKEYFNNAEMPITFYYTDEERSSEVAKPGSIPRCIIGALIPVREGKSQVLDIDAISCTGGKKYCGFTDRVRENFEYFLSYGIPDKVRGERYVKTPEMVKEIMEQSPTFKAPGRFIVFKRWDRLEVNDEPEVIIFFATPDVLAGLFTLARYDETDRNAIQAPFGSGCATIIQYPYQERSTAHPRATLGMFDPSARPFVPKDVLTISVPTNKFVRMVNNMEESFLLTESWRKIQKRISKQNEN
jgi:uncharacterized protein (DUF169 family)